MEEVSYLVGREKEFYLESVFRVQLKGIQTHQCRISEQFVHSRESQNSTSRAVRHTSEGLKLRCFNEIQKMRNGSILRK